MGSFVPPHGVSRTSPMNGSASSGPPTRGMQIAKGTGTSLVLRGPEHLDRRGTG